MLVSIKEASMHSPVKVGGRVSFQGVPRGHFFTDHVHVFESVRSGDVLPSFSPDANVMRCHAILPDCEARGAKPSMSVGQTATDYFGAEFTYLGSKKIADEFCRQLAESLRR
jgi:hypothetical protein